MGTMEAVLLAAAVAGSDAPAPDSAARAAMVAKLAYRTLPLTLMRVEVEEGPPRLGRARLSTEGVEFAFLQLRGNSINQSSAPELVPWSEIRRIDRVHTRAGAGAVLGAATGILVALVWIAQDPPVSEAGFLVWGPTAEAMSIYRILGLAIVGSGLGAGIGSQVQRRERLYP